MSTNGLTSYGSGGSGGAPSTVSIDQRLAVKTAFADYYKAERERAENCLADIAAILTNTEPDQVEQILTRLVEYYQR